MFFKNLQLYRLHDAPALAAEALEAALGEQAYRPLGGSEARRLGWTAPAGRAGTQLLHELNGHRLITALRQERTLPAGVIREETEERVEELETREGRKLNRQEKLTIKEQVYEELLPRAFVRSQKVDLWWDVARGLIGINAGARARAEEVLDLLRETLGSLKVTPLASHTLPMRAMTTWIGDPGARPADLRLGDTVELKAQGDDGVLRGRCVDLDTDEIQQLLESGRQASKLALSIEGRLAFVLHDDLTLKSLRFDDALIDEASQADDGDDPLVRLETDFLLMAQALAECVARLIEWLGGEASAAPQQHDERPADAAPGVQVDGQELPPIGDPLYAPAATLITQGGSVTASALQHGLRIAHSRATRLLEALEAGGIITPPDAQGRRALAAQ